MRKLFLFITMFLFANVLFAQDLIVTNSGDSINCLITNKTAEKIDFKIKKGFDKEDIVSYIPISAVRNVYKDFYYKKEIERKITMQTTGYYLKKSSKSMWGSIISTGVGLLFTTIGASNQNNTMIVLGGVSSLVAIGFEIAVPIYLNKAGNVYK